MMNGQINVMWAHISMCEKVKIVFPDYEKYSVLRSYVFSDLNSRQL